jgi:undecaprenyl phosphate N,N'-diacetylbacillosamine 1-phosphate transferase
LMVFLGIANKGKPFFFQTRPGLNAKSFRIVKFKTMNDKTDAEGKLLPDSERLTKVGSWVRKSSLDELPQFINVLKGDMSLIGPRPLLMRYVTLYNERQMRRHEVRPGITGWAQVNGRNQVPWQERFEMDVWYVENRSLLLDLRIIGLTIQKVVKREGIAAEGTVGMNPFMGNDQ